MENRVLTFVKFLGNIRCRRGLLCSPPRGNQVDGLPRGHTSLGKAPQVGPQLKGVSEHMVLIFTNSVVKVVISEAIRQCRISFREFLVKYRRDPLTFEKVMVGQSFSLGDRNSGQTLRFSRILEISRVFSVASGTV